jgi:hypothetical protein
LTREIRPPPATFAKLNLDAERQSVAGPKFLGTENQQALAPFESSDPSLLLIFSCKLGGANYA